MKLTPESAYALRSDHAHGMTVAECARKYGVSWTHAKRVAAGQSWVPRQPRKRTMPDSVVAEVREALANGALVTSVADAVGYSPAIVSLIKHGKGRFAV